MQKVILTARIDGETHRDLKVIAEREDRSLSYLLRKATEQYVERRSGADAIERNSEINTSKRG